MDEPLKRSKGYHQEDDEKYSLKKYLRLAHVHGLKYLEPKERFNTLFFGLIVAISLCFTVFFVVVTSQSAFSDAITDGKLPPKPVYRLPFPAITICPETKAQKSIINFTDAYLHCQMNQTDQFDDEKISMTEALSQVCDPHLLASLNISDTPTPGEDFKRILRTVSLGPDFLLFCRFRGQVSACSDHFVEAITDDGICYTFNAMNGKSWNLKDYQKSETYDVHPHRALAGSDNGFNIVLNQKTSDLDYLCRGAVQGYKMKIHPPNESPKMLSGYQRIPLNSEVLVSVKPEVNYDNRAGSTCHSSSTKSLKYYNEYSQANCITECLSQFTFAQCGCIKFSMIHNNDTEICNQHKSQCVSDAIQEFATTYRFTRDYSCDCKPTCDSLKYETKITHADYDFKQVFEAYGADLDGEFPDATMSRLIIYLEDEFYVPTFTSTQVSIIDFIAKIGGIFAFFLGASWISIIEVFVYFLRRFSC